MSSYRKAFPKERDEPMTNGLELEWPTLPSPLVLHQLSNDHQYTADSQLEETTLDHQLTAKDVAEAARYDPTRSNVYHLFTRDNPTVSQPLLMNSPGLIQLTNYKNNRRTVVLLHGWLDISFLAFLAAEDVNIIVVDWSVGASSISYRVVIENTIASGIAVAKFIDWLNQETHSSGVQYHIVGHGFGGHQAGIIGRNVQGHVAYITGLDPALVGWVNHIERFQPSDGLYTEVIHTNYGINGYLGDLAQVDFYPNGGISMPGCDSNACDHARSYFYFAESLSSGGFTGRQCVNYFAAVLSTCDLLPGRLQMGGLRPKIGSSGVYLLETNPSPPFSQG
ncbi:Pancreatic lipase 2, partial [Operophtera brumata]